MRIRDVRLFASEVSPLSDFYSRVLGLPPVVQGEPGSDGEETCLQVGSTRLTFYRRPVVEAAPYHFAFNITPRKFAEAKAWLSARVSLLGDGDEYRFSSWNADAVYFRDPVGNVAELIARYDLPDDAPGPFGPTDFLGVSEVGLVVPDVPAFVAEVHNRLGLAAYRPGSDQFAPVGDEHGLLIVVREGRPWFLTDVPARPQPVAMVVEAPIVSRYELPELGYAIMSVGSTPNSGRER